MTPLTFYLLSMFNYMTSLVEYVKRQYNKFSNAFLPENYLFFDVNDKVYPEHLVDLSANLSATPMWSYSKDTHMFRLWGATEKLVPTALPYLSIEVVLDGEMQYDITSFIGQVKVYSIDAEEAPIPSFMNIIVAWSLHSGVIIDDKKGVTYRIIDDSGNTHEVVINNPYEDSDVTEDEELEQEQEIPNDVPVNELSEAEPLLSAENSTNNDKED